MNIGHISRYNRDGHDDNHSPCKSKKLKRLCTSFFSGNSRRKPNLTQKTQPLGFLSISHSYRFRAVTCPLHDIFQQLSKLKYLGMNTVHMGQGGTSRVDPA